MQEMYAIIICASILYNADAQGTMDSIVNNAIQSAFGGGGGRTPIAAFLGGQGGMAPVPGSIGQISARRTVSRGVGSLPTPGSGSGSGAYRALARFSRSNSPAYIAMLHDRSMRASLASRMIAQDPAVGGPTGDGFQRVISDPQITSSYQRAFIPYCYQMPACNVSEPYRRTNGQCNNLINPLLGSSNTPQQRVLPAAYENWIDTPRTRSRVGNMPLPSARTVSNNVFQFIGGDMTPVSAAYSTYLTHHGQFIDHDVISTPSVELQENDCCLPVRMQQNPEACFSIEVVQTPPDPFFPPDKTCMNFVRHAGAPTMGCMNGVREQINQRTAFVDGSMIYGSEVSLELELRGGVSRELGRLAVDDQNLLLPNPKGCPALAPRAMRPCFKAGDHRQSETPTLTVQHITWLRRHNIIADALREATGITNDETLFQEAKRIVIAELQHITYNEFLPAILDNLHMNSFNLKSKLVGHAESYNPKVDPRTINAFGVAAYRMGHSLVRNTVGHDLGNGDRFTFPVSEHFERPDLMYEKGYEFMAHWMSREPKSRSDRFLVDGIRNRLFEFPPMPGTSPSETLSMDLGALNVQRGRDHGIPPYNSYREFCGLQKARFFATAPGGLVDHTPQAAAALQRTYLHPDDIDLFAGGMSEIPRPGSILGPTFQCLIALQFSFYKHGDRFWYERTSPENPVAAFTSAQLAQIKQITYSKILCSVVKNNGIIPSFQPRLMLRPNIQGNSPVPCTLLLQGSRLGFDIRPFAQQLLQLGGRRR
ncbi:peroxidase-like protein [Saccostrea echinata]|uniref:peroxidase-like protein n=1 Tax=Saccostrea echinata TaxID=191078 RepID=UPI002A802936|nr:peroxidase-like protein [Saccostrea echinata]